MKHTQQEDATPSSTHSAGPLVLPSPVLSKSLRRVTYGLCFESVNYKGNNLLRVSGIHIFSRLGIQQREVPGLDSSSFLTVGIISSCLPGIVDVVSGRNTRGENALKCQSISK